MNDNPSSQSPRLLSPAQLAEALGLCSRTVRKMRTSGRIPVIWVGARRPRYDLDDVVEALKAEQSQRKAR